MDNLNPKQFQQQELPGIDWFMLREYAPTYTEHRKPLTPRKTTRETARVALPGMEKVNQFYGDKQRSQQSAELEKLKKNTARYPLPEGFSIIHSTLGHQPDGSLKHVVTLSRDIPEDESHLYSVSKEEVGSMNWNGDTGRVSWFGINAPYRGLASHMLIRAHEIAESMGEIGPTHSDDLSGDSYRMMKRHASAFLPSTAIIDGKTIEEHEAHLAARQRSRWS